MDKLYEYSGRHWAAVVIVSELAKAMKEQDLSEMSVHIPQSSSGDLTVSIKR